MAVLVEITWMVVLIFRAVVAYLTSEATIADISAGLGFTTLIRCDVRFRILFQTRLNFRSS